MINLRKTDHFSERNQLSRNLKRLTSLAALASVLSVFGGTAYADPFFQQIAGGTSSDAPAITTLNEIAILAIRANDTTGAMWYSVAQSNWTKIPTGTTKAAPTLITWGTKVFAFETGEDGNMYSMLMSGTQSTNTANWTFNGSWNVVPGAGGQLQETLRPSVAVAGNNLYLFGTFADQTMRYSVASMDSAGNLSWNGAFTEVPGDGLTTSSVSSVVANNTLTVIQTGEDHNPYAQSMNLTTNQWGPAWVKLPFLIDALDFGTTSSLISASQIAFCGIDMNELRINCAPLTVVQNGTAFTYTVGMQNELNTFTPIPTITHSPTLSFINGNAIVLAATINNATTGQPQVCQSEAGTYESIVTPGEVP